MLNEMFKKGKKIFFLVFRKKHKKKILCQIANLSFLKTEKLFTVLI